MKIIITESQFRNLWLKRRLDELPNHIRSAYDSLNPNAFNTFDEFLNRVINNATGFFIDESMDERDYDFYQASKIRIKPIVRNLVNDKFYKEILDFYNSVKKI